MIHDCTVELGASGHLTEWAVFQLHMPPLSTVQLSSSLKDASVDIVWLTRGYPKDLMTFLAGVSMARKET